MNKTSGILDNLANASPLELGAIMAMLGAGTYGASRLVHDTAKSVMAKPDHVPSDTLVVRLPRANKAKEQPAEDPIEDAALTAAVQNAEKSAEILSDHDKEFLSRNLAKMVLGAGGLAGGYVGASSLYKIIKKKQEEQELEHARNEYVQQLQSMRAKEASCPTPFTDLVCLGMENQLKEAEALTPEQQEAITGENLHAVGSTVSSGVGSLIRGAKAGTGDLSNLAILSLLGAGGLTAGVVYSALQAMQNKKDPTKAKVPQRVVFKYS